MYLSIDVDWLKKNRKRLLEAAKKEWENEEAAWLLIDEETPITMKISDDFKKFEVQIEEHAGIFLTLDIPVTEKLLLQMMEVVVKRINKMRTAIEALKD